MQFTFTLPESLPQMTVKQFLEEQLLIPRKVRHFLKYDTTQGRFDGTVEVKETSCF